MKKFICAASLALILCGCTTSAMKLSAPLPGQKSSSGEDVAANVEGVIHGHFLFYCIPLWTGYPYEPNEHAYATFKNYVTPQYMYRMMDYYCDRHKFQKVEDIKVTESSSGIWTLGILWRRSITGSAVMVGKK